MKQYLTHTDYALWEDVKTLWEAIKTRFGGNKESKKMQKTILKHQYENFTASRSEGLDKTYDRFQKLISQLEIHGEVISQEDANLKLVYEAEIKGQSNSSSNSQNVAFVCLDNTSSTNEAVNTAHDVSDANNEDLEQIDTDDLKEIDLKWAPRSQGNRNRDITKMVVPMETPAKTLVVTDGMGYDWSYQAKEGPTDFALMAFLSSSSSNSDTEVRDNSITELKNQLEESLKEKDDLKLKLEKDLNNKSNVFESAFDSIVNESEEDNNQTNDRHKAGEGYHVVPPPYARNFMPPSPDLSFVGLDNSVFKSAISETVTSVYETATSASKNSKGTGSESRLPMLNKGNYVPRSSRLLRYAKSRPNGKLIHNSILNGPYVRRIIPEPGDTNRDVTVTDTFHVQTDDELSDKEIKQIKADDQAIQTILLGLLEDIYEKKAKFFNEWEKFTSNEGESIESYYHHLLKLMNGLKRNRQFPEKIASNLKFLNNLQPEWSRHVTIVHQTTDLHTADYTQLYDFLKYNQKEVDELKAERLAKTQDPLALMANSNNPYAFSAPHQNQSSFNQNYLQQPMPNPKDITNPTTVMNIALVLMAKAFKLNYSTPTNNNQRILSNPRNKQIAQPGMNMGQDRQMQMVGGNGGNQFRQYAGNLTGYNDVIGNQIRCYNCRGIGHYARNCTVKPKRRDAAYLQTQLLIAQKEKAGIQLQAEEYDLMATAADLDKIEEVNANCIMMANMQQASTSEEQYTELLELILESHQVSQNDNDVTSEVKEDSKKDKIRSKPDKNRKHGEALKCQKQLQSIEEEKLKKTEKEGT
nr:hypothetical protein [Tanacetum cinerariifolium]